MKRFFLLAGFSALAFHCISQTPKLGQFVSAYSKAIGPVSREIAETSPVATEMIERVAPDPRILTTNKIAVRYVIRNTTDHEIHYIEPLQTFNVTDVKTGERVPETPFGCSVNFFSKCYTSRMPAGIGNGMGDKSGKPRIVVPPHGSVEYVGFLDASYQLSVGEFSVVGYFCADEREGPECFKSNKITITIGKP
jgi:hypothetical protein